jgi:hypothetical protein
MCILGAVGIWFLRDKPDNSPSLSQFNKEDIEFDLKEDFRDLFRTKGFLFGSIASALFIAYSVDVSKGLA